MFLSSLVVHRVLEKLSLQYRYNEKKLDLNHKKLKAMDKMLWESDFSVLKLIATVVQLTLIGVFMKVQLAIRVNPRIWT